MGFWKNSGWLLIGLISTGCCGMRPCGPMGWSYPGACSTGCGELYVDEHYNHPPVVEHCGGASAAVGVAGCGASCGVACGDGHANFHTQPLLHRVGDLLGVRYVPAGTGPVVYRAPVRGYHGGAWNANGALGGQSGICGGDCGDSGCQNCTGCSQGCEGNGGCSHCAGGSSVMDGGPTDGQVINETWSDEQVVEGVESSVPSQTSMPSVSPQAPTTPAAPSTPSIGNPQTRKARPTGNVVRQASSQRFSPAEQKRQRPPQAGGRSNGQPTRRP
jgi:hypothetical protein